MQTAKEESCELRQKKSRDMVARHPAQTRSTPAIEARTSRGLHTYGLRPTGCLQWDVLNAQRARTKWEVQNRCESRWFADALEQTAQFLEH